MLTNSEGDLRERLKDPAFAAEFGSEYARAELALLLTKARRQRKLTQGALAEQLGISQPYLARLESGEANPTIGRIGRILAVLGFKISSGLDMLIEDEKPYRAKETAIARVMDGGR